MTDILSVKGGYGGTFIEDRFTVKSCEVVADLIGPYNEIGHDATIVMPNRTGVMLAPPLKFIFKSKRVVRHGQPDRFPTELIVRGHYVTAVDFVGKPLHWCLDFKRCEYGDKAKEKYKQALARSLLKFYDYPKRRRTYLRKVAGYTSGV